MCLQKIGPVGLIVVRLLSGSGMGREHPDSGCPDRRVRGFVGAATLLVGRNLLRVESARSFPLLANALELLEALLRRERLRQFVDR